MATIHIVKFDPEIAIHNDGKPSRKLLDYLIKDGQVDQNDIKNGDILENSIESGYRSDGWYQFLRMDDSVQIINLNYDYDDYGSPAKCFTFPEFSTSWFENANKSNSAARGYWHSLVPPLYFPHRGTIYAYNKAPTIPWFMIYEIQDDKWIIFLQLFSNIFKGLFVEGFPIEIECEIRNIYIKNHPGVDLTDVEKKVCVMMNIPLDHAISSEVC